MPQKLTTEKFIEKAKKIHGERYDYSLTNYNGSYSKIKIICPLHGLFEQVCHDHLKKQGCAKCAKNIKLTTSDFINRSKIIHKNKYDYSKTFYTKSGEKIKIICPIHGIFEQVAYGHLNGYGCSKCAPINRHQNIPKSNKTFIEECNKIHNNKYDYSSTNYKTATDKIEIKCLKHGIFLQKPSKHLMGHGCPKCSHKVSKPEILFLDYLQISINNRQKYIAPFRVDGVKNNKIYEFLGDYYHGNPKKYNPQEYNKICHKTFEDLYQNTISKFIHLNKIGYDIYYIWEHDWNLWSKDKTKSFPIKKYTINQKI